MKSTRVVFLAPYVKHYRIPFYERLHKVLEADGIALTVLYGLPNEYHAARKDNVVPSFAYGRPVKSRWLMDRVVYQSAWRDVLDADLVITPAESKVLLNPMLIALRSLAVKRLAFWGKGDIRPASVVETGEWLRYQLAGSVDWWFAYTQESAQNLRRHGVRCGITAVDNAIDTSSLRQQMSDVTPACLQAARACYNVSDGPTGIFCGNLSANKQLEFLFESARVIQQAIPNFSLLVVGNGPMRETVERAAVRDRFIRYMGPRVGAEKAVLLKMSDVFLLPGAVGLAILDAFTASLPLLTTRGPKHGPEIGYLEDGKNGSMCEQNVQVYADRVIQLLRDPVRLQQMQAAAEASSREHSIESMTLNFRRGILECLGRSAEDLPNAALLTPFDSYSSPENLS